MKMQSRVTQTPVQDGTMSLQEGRDSPRPFSDLFTNSWMVAFDLFSSTMNLYHNRFRDHNLYHNREEKGAVVDQTTVVCNSDTGNKIETPHESEIRIVCYFVHLTH